MRCERFDERTSQSSNRGDQLKSESWSRRTKSLVFQKPKREREKSAGLWSSFASTVNNDRVKKRQRFREYRVYSCCTNEKWTTWVSKITGPASVSRGSTLNQRGNRARWPWEREIYEHDIRGEIRSPPTRGEKWRNANGPALSFDI